MFRDRLDKAEIGLTATSRAAEDLGAIVDVVQASEVQTRVTPADIAPQPHLPVGLGERPEGEGTMRPGSNEKLCFLLCKLDYRRSEKRYCAKKLSIAFSLILQLHHQIGCLFGTPLSINILAVGHLELPCYRKRKHSPGAAPRDRSLFMSNV